MWSPKKIETLKSLWLKGLSATQIATKLGGGLTRNAVIGKIHRLGLTRDDKSTQTVTTTKTLVKDKKLANPKSTKSTKPVKLELTLIEGVAPKSSSVKKKAPSLTVAQNETLVALTKDLKTINQFKQKASLDNLALASVNTNLQLKKRSHDSLPKKLITLVELRPNMCKYPLGDPSSKEFSFCGKEKVPHNAYCTHHHSVAYMQDVKKDKKAL